MKLNDNRSTEQRFFDRFGNLGTNFVHRNEEASKKIFEHDSNLGFAGNGFQIVNGLALAASNGFKSIGEVLGVDDAVDGVKGDFSIGTMHALEPFSTDWKMAIISGLGGAAGAANDVQAGISNWAAQHPNAAEGISAAVNVGTAVWGTAKGIDYVRSNYEFAEIGGSSLKRSQMGAVSIPKKKTFNTDSNLEKAQKRADRLSAIDRSGKDFTKAGKEVVIDLNRIRNNGSVKCSNCGVKTVPATKSRRNITPSKNERQVDHVIPKAKGGQGSPKNGQVLCRYCNRKKGSK
ncbi:MAG: MafB family polymorphic toxin [Neisseria sp.]|nr:HNH endonuclease [Neisseria sp.]MDO4641906.1 MafB family polymorphic toxin [Neisseria sp.]